MEPKPKKLLDRVRDAIRVKHYSYRTEQTYVDWIERYIRFHQLRHPAEMNVPEIEAFLTHLAVERNLIALLRGEPALGERAQAAVSFGKLSFRSENALSKLIGQLITRELVAETLLPHGGIALGVTKAGRQLLNSAQPVDSPPPAR